MPGPPLYFFTMCGASVRHKLVETRIKPFNEQVAEQQRRTAQRHAFRRNQAIGLVLIAAAICLWWLLHTNPQWIFPPGWWRP